MEALAPPSRSHPLADDLEHVLAHTMPLWEELRHARLFLAGGTGFFGLWMLESFLWADERLGLDAEVTVLARDGRRFARLHPRLAGHPRLTFLPGDVRSFEFPQGEFTHVAHLATDTTLPAIPENVDRTVDTIVNGTRRVLRFASECGARKLLFASSGAVYGLQPTHQERLSEAYVGGTDPAAPIAAYAEGKRVAEILVRSATGFDATIARAFAFVGPHLPLDAHFAVGNFLRDALTERPIEILGDPGTVRSYLHAADLAIWLWTILLRGRAGRAYNVGSERAVTLLELAHIVADATGTHVPVRVAPSSTIRPTSHRYVPDTGRAREELGLRPSLSLEESVRRTFAYHRLVSSL